MGTEEAPVIEYYHRYVVLQLVCVTPALMLDAEPVRPGETECAAALRLLRRLRQEYGRRFFDVVVVDSWYTNGPFLKTVVKNFDRKPASTRHLAGILGQMTGADWRPFFDRYVYGTEMPPID